MLEKSRGQVHFLCFMCRYSDDTDADAVAATAVEAPFAINSGERRRKRSVWKPSSVETMENFVDLQEVRVVYICEGGVVYCVTD